MTSAAEVTRHFLSLSAAAGCPPSHLNQEEDLMLVWRSSGDDSLDLTWSSCVKMALEELFIILKTTII